jgi:hypothetical protein
VLILVYTCVQAVLVVPVPTITLKTLLGKLHSTRNASQWKCVQNSSEPGQATLTQFEQWMERRRGEETDAEALQVLRQGWCLGSKSWRREMLPRMQGKLGDHHSGELHRASGNRSYNQRSCEKWPKPWADVC